MTYPIDFVYTVTVRGGALAKGLTMKRTSGIGKSTLRLGCLNGAAKPPSPDVLGAAKSQGVFCWEPV